MMTKLLGLAALIFVGVTGWQLGGRLSSDAIGMALGILFGIMAGIPASLMVLAARRRDYDEDDYHLPYRRQHYRALHDQERQQPPIIVVTGYNDRAPQSGPYPMQSHEYEGQISGPVDTAPRRQFRVVGESEEVTDLW